MRSVAQVTTVQSVLGDLPITEAGFGIVQFDPAGQRGLAAEIEARVLELSAQPGDSVAEGAVLLRLGPSSSAGVEIARVRRDADLATEAAARTRRLRADGLASDGDVQAAENAAKDQAALAESLEARVRELSALRAPVGGLVDEVLVGPGDLVAPGTALVRLASLEQLQARIGIEIEDATRLEPGAEVLLSSLDKVQVAVSSRIATIDYRVDPVTRMSTVLVPIPTRSGLLPGEAVRAEITVETRRGVVLVPRRSVFTDERGPYAFVANDGVASLRRVEVGATSGALTEIQAGMEVGEAVIVEGAAVLADGMQVREAPLAGAANP
jgi:membrane fusion protein (multidrug efflux system)